jgi:hypothetical protein
MLLWIKEKENRKKERRKKEIERLLTSSSAIETTMNDDFNLHILFCFSTDIHPYIRIYP